MSYVHGGVKELTALMKKLLLGMGGKTVMFGFFSSSCLCFFPSLRVLFSSNLIPFVAAEGGAQQKTRICKYITGEGGTQWNTDHWMGVSWVSPRLPLVYMSTSPFSSAALFLWRLPRHPKQLSQLYSK